MSDAIFPLGALAEGSIPEHADPAADDMLAVGLKAGDEAAYEILLTRFQQPIYNLIYRLLADPSEASDVLQEVFLKVFRKIGSFRGESSLRTWIYRVAVNEAYNHRRWFSRHRRQEVELEADEDRHSGPLTDRERSPFELACGRETIGLVEEALTRINPDFRAAVVLRDIEDFSYEEIAQILGISVGTVKSRILRGRESLRRELAPSLQAQPRNRLAAAEVRS